MDKRNETPRRAESALREACFVKICLKRVYLDENLVNGRI